MNKECFRSTKRSTCCSRVRSAARDRGDCGARGVRPGAGARLRFDDGRTPMDNSAMDGCAVRASEVTAPETRLRIAQRIAAGEVGKPLAPGTAARIFTGAPIPEGADAIVMQEFCAVEGEAVVVRKVPKPGDRSAARKRCAQGRHDRSGRKAPAAAGHRPRRFGRNRRDAGLSARAAGAVLHGRRAGDAGEPLAPGRIYNSNRFTLNGMAHAFGCDVRDYGIVRTRWSDAAMLRRASAECDLIVTSGGVSVGEADFVKPAVEAEGSLLMWKISMKPGRPLAFGRIGACAFIGLPGNPVSSFVTFLISSGRSCCAPRAVRSGRASDGRADFDWSDRIRGANSCASSGTQTAGSIFIRRRIRCSRRPRGPTDWWTIHRTMRSAEATACVSGIRGALLVKVKVLFFAALRESIGVASEEVDLPGETSTVAALRAHSAARGGAWTSALAEKKLLRFAVNQDLVRPHRHPTG